MAAYNRRDAMTDNRTELSYSWKHETDLVHAAIIAPDNAPEWVYDSETLWNKCEAKENRKNSQTAHSMVMMLPRELDDAGCIAAVENFVKQELVSKGMVVDYAIQRNKAGDGMDNPHVHMLMTTRELDADSADGWAKTKNREWADNDKLIEKRAYALRSEGKEQEADALLDTRQIITLRRAWAGCVNQALEDAEANGRTDHRKLVVQQADAIKVGDIAKAIRLDREPQPYIPHYRIVKRLAEIPEYVTAKLRAVNAAKLQRLTKVHLAKIGSKTRGDIARMMQQAQAGLAQFIGQAPQNMQPAMAAVQTASHERTKPVQARQYEQQTQKPLFEIEWRVPDRGDDRERGMDI